MDIPNKTWRLDFKIAASSAFMPQLSAAQEQNAFAQMLNDFRNITFYLNQAKRIDCVALINAYNIEEESFQLTVSINPYCSSSSDENIVSSHVIYMVEINHAHTFKLKVIISPHGSEYFIES